MKKNALLFSLFLTLYIAIDCKQLNAADSFFNQISLKQTSVLKLLNRIPTYAREKKLAFCISVIAQTLHTSNKIELKKYKEIIDAITLAVVNLFYLNNECDKSDLMQALKWLEQSAISYLEQKNVSKDDTARVLNALQRSSIFLTQNSNLNFECCICLEKKSNIFFHKNNNIPHFFCRDCINQSHETKQNDEYLKMLDALKRMDFNQVQQYQCNWQYKNVTKNDECPICRAKISLDKIKSVYADNMINTELYLTPDTF